MEIKALVIDLDGCLYPSASEMISDKIAFRRIDEYLKKKRLLNKMPKGVEERREMYLREGLTSELVEYLSQALKIDMKPFSKYAFDIHPEHAGIKRDPKLSKMFSELSNYYQLWIFSNSPAVWVKRTLNCLGIKRYIQDNRIINMDNMGKRIKPHANAFRFMLKKIRLRKDEIIFLDDRKRNIDGALKVGITSKQSKGGSGNKRNSTYYILTKMLEKKRQKKL